MKQTASTYQAKLGKIVGCFFCVLFFLPTLATAQKRGRLEVIKDPLIDTLIARRPMLTGRASSSNWGETTYGYRVQIYSGSSRQAAYGAQARFNSEYPEMRTYITYSEPNFKVHAGDFRSRLEAEKVMQEIRPLFTTTFIMSERINPPKTQPDQSE